MSWTNCLPWTFHGNPFMRLFLVLFLESVLRERKAEAKPEIMRFPSFDTSAFESSECDRFLLGDFVETDPGFSVVFC